MGIGIVVRAGKSSLCVLVICIFFFNAKAIVAAPATWVQSVTYDGEIITMRLTRENLRGSNFELWEQNSSGGYDVVTPVDERSYIGTIDEHPGAISCGILSDDDTTFRGAVYFDRGVSWFTTDNAVISTRALDYGSFSNFAYPFIPTVQAGQAGSVMYGFDVGVDADYDYYNNAGSTATAFENIEYSVCLVRAIYMKDVLLQPYLGRVIIRASLPHDPYTGLTQGDYLSAVRTEWNTNHTDADRDVVAGVSPTKIGGGLAWVGVIATSSAYSVSQGSGSSGRFDVVWRHEMGHNWGCGHFVGGSPEGKGIMGGNQPARFTGCEAYKIFNHRDSRDPGVLDDLGTYSAIDLPPYAALDMEIFTHSVTSSLTLDVLANDYDGNGQALSLDAYDATSAQGGTVTLQGQDLVYTAPGAYLGSDYFLYEIIDSINQTATGAVVIDVQPNESLRLYLPLDESTGTTAYNFSAYAKDSSLSGDATFDADSVAGQFGTAIQLDGVNDEVLTPSLNLNSNNVTITGWIKRNGNQNSYGIAMCVSSTTKAGLNFRNTTNLGYHWGSTSYWAWDSGLVVPDNQWTFVALAVEPTKATIYMNTGTGMQTSTHTGTHDVEEFDNIFRLGSYGGWGGRYVDGAIDDIRIYNRTLNASEIQDIYEGGRAESPSPFDNAEDVLPISSLRWAPGAAAVNHDVYFGTDYNAVSVATTASDEYQDRQPETYYTPSAMAANTEYFWRVDQVDEFDDVIAGVVWSFTTGNGTGAITREVWEGISGAYVYDLTDNAAYPDSPTFTDTLSMFEEPTDWADNYGTKIHGYVIPKESGIYTFWIASDDRSELWLSSDRDPANVEKIAEVAGIMPVWTDPREWDKYPSQQSETVRLFEGESYYIMALHKEGNGGDNIAVAWEGPGIAQQVISGQYLMPYYEDFNWGPVFSADPIVASDAIEGSSYDYSIAGIAEAFNGGDVTYAKTAGPLWLTVAANGVLSGIPSDMDVSDNTFTITATDTHGDFNEAILEISVLNSFTGELGLTDLAALVSRWLNDGCDDIAGDASDWCYGTDLDQSGQVNGFDFSILGGNWLKDIEPPLIAHWKLDESNGAIAYDSSGNNYDGDLINSPTWQPTGGQINGAIELDGSTNYVEISAGDNLDTQQITMTAWVHPDTVTSSDIMFVLNRQMTLPGTFALWQAGQSGDNKWGVQIRLEGDESNGITIYSNESASLTWTHIAATYGGTDFKLYINGTLQLDVIHVSGTLDTDSSGNLYLGSHPNETFIFDGLIDDVRIYNRALTSVEIDALAN